MFLQTKIFYFLKRMACDNEMDGVCKIFITLSPFKNHQKTIEIAFFALYFYSTHNSNMKIVVLLCMSA